MNKPPSIPQYGNGIIIHDWMVRLLQLQGDELIVYAVIHSFSKDGHGVFHGSISYLSFWTGKSKPTILKVLRLLLGKILIEKEEVQYTRRNPSRHYCRYWTVFSRLSGEEQKKMLAEMN